MDKMVLELLLTRQELAYMRGYNNWGEFAKRYKTVKITNIMKRIKINIMTINKIKNNIMNLVNAKNLTEYN